MEGLMKSLENNTEIEEDEPEFKFVDLTVKDLTQEDVICEKTPARNIFMSDNENKKPTLKIPTKNEIIEIDTLGGVVDIEKQEPKKRKKKTVSKKQLDHLEKMRMMRANKAKEKEEIKEMERIKKEELEISTKKLNDDKRELEEYELMEHEKNMIKLREYRKREKERQIEFDKIEKEKIEYQTFINNIKKYKETVKENGVGFDIDLSEDQKPTQTKFIDIPKEKNGEFHDFFAW